MSTEPTNERSTRIVALAKCLVDAAELMERGEWVSCQAKCAQASWEARMLHLLERQEAKEDAK